MSSKVEYRNLRSRLILKRGLEEQMAYPPEPPKLTERFLKWYERTVLDVDTRHIQIDRPIFLIGLPRSGTTMLQDIICTHPQVAYITNTMHKFRSCFCAAEDLRKRFKIDFRGERFLGDSVEVEAGSPNEGPAFFAELFGLNPSSVDYVELRFEDFPADWNEKAQQTIRKMIWCFGSQADRFFNKGTFLVPYILLIKDMFPNAKIIHIVRDARMCANSMVKLYRRNREQEAKLKPQLRHSDFNGDFLVPFPRLPRLAEYIEHYGPDDIRTTANLWNDAVSFVDERKDQLPFFYEVRFEDILANPKEEIFNILEFCELPKIADDQIEFWRKLDQVGVVQHTNQYGDFEIVEEICRDNLQRYGYL
jgi:hypothetical protein